MTQGKSPLRDWQRRGRSTTEEIERLMKIRSKVSPQFIEALRRDFEAHGAEAVAYARISRSATYLKLSMAFLGGLPEEEEARQREERNARIAKLREEMKAEGKLQ